MRGVSSIMAAVALAGSAAWADPVEGIWQTQVDDGRYGHILMAPCGAAFCGVISRSFDSDGEYESENKTKKIVIDMKPLGHDKYRGKVWRPANDKIYVGKMQLNGDTLELAGCVAGGLFCKSQVWTRVK